MLKWFGNSSAIYRCLQNQRIQIPDKTTGIFWCWLSCWIDSPEGPMKAIPDCECDWQSDRNISSSRDQLNWSIKFRIEPAAHTWMFPLPPVSFSSLGSGKVDHLLPINQNLLDLSLICPDSWHICRRIKGERLL